MGAFTGQDFSEDEPDDFSLLFIYNQLTTYGIVAIGRTRYFVSAVLEAAFYRPLAVFRDGDRFVLSQST